MKFRILIAILVCFLSRTVVSAADETTVALAISEASSQQPEEQELTKTLLDLLELNVSNTKNIAVVERMQIDKILQEIVLNRSRDVEQSQQPQLGKLLTADLILTVQIQRKENQTDDPETEQEVRYQAISTVVDSLTGAIRGRSIEDFPAVAVDDAASRIARYLRSVIESPQQSGVTLAIGAFESLGRFERLRSIETGLQELMTAELQQMGDFRVVRRTDMQSLNEEFRLMRSGLADATQLPDTLPNRSAAYLLRGTIDEQTEGRNRRVVVNAVLVNALSQKIVHQFRLEVAPQKIPKALGKELEALAQKLAGETHLSPDEIRRPVKTLEAGDLSLMARRDLERFVRISPIDGTTHWFSLPGSPEKPEDRAPLVDADSPLGRHLLLKSIDRLESALYINPDLIAAQYSLGFCYSYHLPDIYNPERSEQLMQQIYKQNPEHERAIPALWLLSEIDYHHKGRGRGVVDLESALERTVYAFESMPAAGRTLRWTWLVEQIHRLSRGAPEKRIPLRVVHSGARLLPETEGKVRESLAQKLTRLASLLLTVKGLESSDRNELRELLVRWAESDQPDLPIAATRALAEVASSEKNYELAADWYERAAKLHEKDHKPASVPLKESFLVKAAREHRSAGQPQIALKLLDKIDPKRRPQGHNYLYGLELGMTLEALDQPKQALEIYLSAAEAIPGMVDNTNVLTRINALGGVPLREVSDVTVKYVPPHKKQPFLVQKLATDGRRLFCAGRALRPPQDPVFAVYDITSGVWSQVKTEFRGISCLSCAGGPLWVGTKEEGIWRYSPQDNSWTQWSEDNGLPDNRVVSLALDGRTLYAGVGTPASGGLVTIDRNERIRVLDSAGTPKFAPTHIAFDTDQIVARTREAIHRYDRDTGEWSVLEDVGNPKVFSGSSNIWASDLRKQLYSFDLEGKLDARFRPAWAPANKLGANYLVDFVVEQDDQIWFGGTAVRRFLTTGLYRFDRATGKFTVYGPRDGFRFQRTFTSYAAVWALDRLWVAGDGGLAEVEFVPEK